MHLCVFAFAILSALVGGGNSNPFSAEYIPPAPQEVPDLLEDLVCYMNRTDVLPVVQAALCHAQFESIHPFADGNGRTGRALIHVCLIRRGLVGHAVPPISLALATEKDDYVDALRGVQHCLNKEEESRAYNDWVSCFCGAVSRACSDMEEIASDMEAIRRDWIGRLGKVRANSSLDLLLDEIQAVPIFTAETMAKAVCRTEVAVGQAIDRLLEAGIIRQSNKGKRRRIFETPDVMEMFNLVERRLASPSRDTKAEPPARPVPERYGH